MLYNLLKKNKKKLKSNIFINIIYEYCEIYYDFANSLLLLIYEEILNTENNEFFEFALELLENL